MSRKVVNNENTQAVATELPLNLSFSFRYITPLAFIRPPETERDSIKHINVIDAERDSIKHIHVIDADIT